MNRYADRIHPVTAFIYLLSTLLTTMLTDSWIILIQSLICATAYSVTLIGVKKTAITVAWCVPMSAFIVLTNMLFVRDGATVLFYMGEWAVTLEAIIYGLVMSAMMSAVLLWCRCYSAVLTADKFSYIFGNIAPKISLLLIMTSRFIPMLFRRARQVDEGQRMLGVYSTRGYYDRVASRMRVLTALMSWSLEGGIMTADSMRARGYGIGKRTSLNRRKCNAIDIAVMILTAICALGFIGVMIAGVCDMTYYPAISKVGTATADIVIYCVLGLYLLSGTIAEIVEVCRWR